MDNSAKMKAVATIILVSLAVASVNAGEAVSSAFTLDLHYEPSGEVFPGEPATEVWGLSSRWMGKTTDWAADSNEDGIPDWWEEKYGVTAGGLQPLEDFDGDGYVNIVEYNAGMNPLAPDKLALMSAVCGAYRLDTGGLTDMPGAVFDLNEVWCLSSLFSADTVGWDKDSDVDGLPDWWERLYGLNPNVADSHLDSDGDGLINLQEYNAGTDPVRTDDWQASISESGRAFATDTRVCYSGGNPTFDETFAVIKVSHGFICDTGGLYYDWDGDGIPNWWEARFSRGGSKTGLGAADDDDGDGMSNYGEFIAYTDPTNINSKFTIEIAPIASRGTPLQHSVRLLSVERRQSNGNGTAGLALKWRSAKGRVYSVFATERISEGFGRQPIAEIEGTGDDIEYDVGDVIGVRFFKVEIVVP